MTQCLVIGNWKMNGGLQSNGLLLQALTGVPVDKKVTAVVCAPYPYLGQVQQQLSSSCFVWGAQDVSAQENGAYTGEVSATMLLDFGCKYVIVGHSERRSMHTESDDLVAQKAAKALEHGMTPVVCVGETLDEKESGLTHAVVTRQLNAVIEVLGHKTASIVLAYEPVWAIGTGKTATPAQAQAVHADLRSQLIATDAGNVPILYGGSVKPDNASELFAQSDINGGLIGGAALKAEDFLAIISAAQSVRNGI